MRPQRPTPGLSDRFDSWLRRTSMYTDRPKPEAHPLPLEPTEPRPSRVLLVAGTVVGLLLPVVVAAALIPLRGVIAPSNSALILVLPVVVVALIAGFVPGAAAAVSAALAFDFFLTRPYYSPRMQAAEDIESATVLLAIALIVSRLVAREVTARDRSSRRLEELQSLRSVAKALTQRDPKGLIEASLKAIDDLLDVDTTWVPGYHGKVDPVLGRDGSIVGQRDASVLPSHLELPVVAGAVELGRINLRARTRRVVSKEERQSAIALADLMASGLPRAGQGSDGPTSS